MPLCKLMYIYNAYVITSVSRCICVMQCLIHNENKRGKKGKAIWSQKMKTCVQVLWKITYELLKTCKYQNAVVLFNINQSRTTSKDTQ